MTNLIVVLLIAVAVVVGLFVVSIERPAQLEINTSIGDVAIDQWHFLLALLVALIALYFIVRVLVRFVNAPRDIKRRNKRKRTEKAQVDTLRGYAGLIEGDWDGAERMLVKRLDASPTPMLNYLGAAYAAQQRGDAKSRDKYLIDAAERDPRNKLAVALTQARLQYQMGQLPEARASIKKLTSAAPRNRMVLRMAADLYQDLGDWPALIDLMPKLRNGNAFTDDELRTRELLAHSNHASGSALAHDDNGEKILAGFKALPRGHKRNAGIIGVYASELINAGNTDKAEVMLHNALKREWNSELAYLYGTFKSNHAEAQLATAQAWLIKHPNDPDLILTMARLSIDKGDLENAKHHLEHCIQIGGRQEAHIELGNLLENQGDAGEAMTVYKRGLKSVISPAAVASATPIKTERILAGQSNAIQVVDNG